MALKSFSADQPEGKTGNGRAIFRAAAMVKAIEIDFTSKR